MSTATPVVDLSPVKADTAALLARPVGAVKSVQRGVTSVNAGTTGVMGNVTIAAVNTAKSFLTVSSIKDGMGRITSATNINIGHAGNYSGDVYWEVIEFE